MAALAIGLGVVGVLWARSEAARRQTAAEALRAESAKLLALAQVELERDPTAALAYVTKSLELADTEEARRLGLRVLQGGPTQLTAATVPGNTALGVTTRPLAVAFSPNGEWFAVTGAQGTQLFRRDGGMVATIEETPTDSIGSYAFDSESRLLIGNRSTHVGVWSVPDGREIRRLEIEPGFTFLFLFVRGRGFFASATVGDREVVRWAALTEADSRLVGTMDAAVLKDVDAAGAWMAYVPGGYMSGNRRLHLRSLQNWALTPRLIATHPADIAHVAFHPDGRQVAAGDTAGTIRIWATNGGSGRPLRVLDCPGLAQLTYSRGGRWLAAIRAADYSHYVQLWDLTAPPSAEPLRVRIDDFQWDVWAFDPSERWLATPSGHGVALWPLGATYPRSVGRHDWLVDNVAFTPVGSTLVSVAGNTVSARSVLPGEPGDERILLHTSLNYAGLAVDPAGRRVAVSSWGRVLVLPLAGGAARELMGLSNAPPTGTVAFSPDGRRLAAAGVQGALGDTVVRIWDLASGGSRVLGPLPGSGSVGDAAFATDLAFADDDHVVTGSLTSGLLLFDLHDGTHTVLSSRPTLALAVDRGRRVVLALAGESEPKELVRLGLDGQAPATVFPCPGCHSVALDPTGMVVAAGSADGIVRIGPASGGEPHLFFGHPSASLQKVAFSPDGRWVASSGEQPGVRLWPVPDVTRPPLHRRSHDELLATLHSWTNLRAVKDPQSPTGWKLEPGPFPGWAKLPRW